MFKLTVGTGERVWC